MRSLNWVSDEVVNIRRSPVPQQHPFAISQLLKQWGEEAQSYFKYVLNMMLPICRFPLRLMPQNETQNQKDFITISMWLYHLFTNDHALHFIYNSSTDCMKLHTRPLIIFLEQHTSLWYIPYWNKYLGGVFTPSCKI